MGVDERVLARPGPRTCWARSRRDGRSARPASRGHAHRELGVRVEARCPRRCRRGPARGGAAASASRWARPWSSCDDPAGDLLAQGEGRRVLQVGAADLHDVAERLRLRRAARRAARARRGTTLRAQGLDGGHVHGGGEDVVAWTGPCSRRRSGGRGAPRRARRPGSRWRGWRAPRSRSCWSGCRCPSARPRAGTRRRACRPAPRPPPPRWPAPFFSSRTPRSMLTRAAAFLTRTSARTSARRHALAGDAGSWSSERWVCAPQSRSAGTSMGPKVSRSSRVLMAFICPPLCKGVLRRTPLKPRSLLIVGWLGDRLVPLPVDLLALDERGTSREARWSSWLVLDSCLLSSW